MDLFMTLVVTLMATSSAAFVGLTLMDGRRQRWTVGRSAAARTSGARADARPSLLPRTIRQTPID